MTKPRFLIHGLGLLLGTWWTLSATVCHALPINVTLDTTPISGGSFAVIFDLIDGDATINNTAIVNSFDFGGGSPAGGPFLFGDATGSLSGTVTLGDTTFFNEFLEGFTPGSVFDFHADLTTNFAGGTPDSFSFLLLDNSTGLPIPTLDPLGTDVLLSVDLTNPALIQTFGTDLSRTSIAISAPQVSSTSTIPEPSSLLLLGIGLLGIRRTGGSRLRRAARWAGRSSH